MKAILPVYCRLLGYVVLFAALALIFILLFSGVITDSNLTFYKECTKLLMMLGALMILMALNKNESPTTEKIRVKAMRQAVFITILFVFGNMLYKVAIKDPNTTDSTSFLIFMIINVLCLEFGMVKAKVDTIFKR